MRPLKRPSFPFLQAGLMSSSAPRGRSGRSALPSARQPPLPNIPLSAQIHLAGSSASSVAQCLVWGVATGCIASRQLVEIDECSAVQRLAIIDLSLAALIEERYGRGCLICSSFSRDTSLISVSLQSLKQIEMITSIASHPKAAS